MSTEETKTVVTPETETPVVEGGTTVQEPAAETAQPQTEVKEPKTETISEKQYKDNQRTINKLQREIAQLKERSESPALMAQLEALNRKVEILADNMNTPAVEPDLFSETPTPKKSNIRERFASIDAESKANTERIASLSKSQQEKAQKIGRLIADAGLQPDDPRLDGIREAWLDNDYDGAVSTARALISLIKTSPKPEAAKPAPAEPPKEKIDKTLLRVDASAPTGSGNLSSPSEIRQAYRAGRISTDQFAKLRGEGRV